MRWSSINFGSFIRISINRQTCLQNITGALFTKWIDLLTWKSREQTIFGLMLRDVFNKLRNSLRHWHSLDGCFTAQLFSYGPVNYYNKKITQYYFVTFSFHWKLIKINKCLYRWVCKLFANISMCFVSDT